MRSIGHAGHAGFNLIDRTHGEPTSLPDADPSQVERIAAHGRRRATAAGEVLVEPGARPVPFFLVRSGAIQIVRPDPIETLIVGLGPGQFSGETNMITGRPALARARVGEPGEVIELDREQLLALIQTDAELSEILMPAFILRRVELIARGYGDVILIGSSHCAGTLRAKEFLTRNGHPHVYIDLDRESDAQELLDRFHVTAADVPVLICRGETVLRNPANQQIAACLGLKDGVEQTHVRDLVVVKTGPDLSPDDLAAAGWPRRRAPYLLETSRPGVFAVGDERGGNIKRVASAVGEGSIAIAFVHQVLQQ